MVFSNRSNSVCERIRRRVMSDNINEYQPMKNPHMIEVFEKLFELKSQKKLLDAQIKKLEAEYKPVIEQANRDELYYELPNKQRFSIVKSTRVGAINKTKLEAYGLDPDDFRNKSSVVFTLRIKEDG